MAAVQGLLGLSWVIGLILGPIIGALFAENEHLTWRWAFYIIPPFIVGIALPLALFGAPSVRVKNGKSLLINLATIDWVGFTLHSATVVLFALATVFSGTTWPWNSAAGVALWVVLVLVAIAYGLQQTFSLFTTPERRLIPVDVFKYRTVLLVCIAHSVMSVSYSMALYYPPLFFEFVRGDSPVTSAVRMMPFVGSFVALVLFAGALLPLIRLYAAMYMTAGLLIVGASAFLVTITPDSGNSEVLGTTALLGVATGIVFPIGVGINAFMLPKRHGADAALLNILFLSLPITIALGIAGCLYHNVGFHKLQSALGPYGFSDDDIRETLAGLTSKVSAAADPQVKILTIQAITSVIAGEFYIVLAAGLIMVVAAGFMRWEGLDFKGRKAAEIAEVEQT
ncbi:hypothetical protein BJ170DRAFT_629680 [Xylariales sp. AK1849]|nr:hypothetical protein BJ170DRAFT_629680 [Xylariales sp. AK1849]